MDRLMSFDFDPFAKNDVSFEYEDTAYQGKLLKATMDLDVLTTMHFDDPEIKRLIKKTLSEHLAKGILENNLVEFTSMDDPLTRTKKIYARCFLTPDGDVKMLRTAKAVK
jgi:hypothetical protein